MTIAASEQSGKRLLYIRKIKVKSKQFLFFLFSLLFIFLKTTSSLALPKEFRSSIGKVTFYFKPCEIEIFSSKGQPICRSSITEKSCNGFLIKKDNRVYLVTVLHLSKIFKDGKLLPFKGGGYYKVLSGCDMPEKVTFEVPNSKVKFTLSITNDNFFDGDNLARRKESGYEETIDVCCIDVTNYIDEINKNEFISYDLLGDIDKKQEIDSSAGKVFVCGYPEGDIQRSYQELLSSLDPPINFGALFPIGNGEAPSGFSFDAKLLSGDCGRPIIIGIPAGYMVIGLFKTSRGNGSVAIDSTAIRRTIQGLKKTIAKEQ